MKIDPERGRLKKKQNQIVGLIKKPLQHLGQNHQSFKITGFSRMTQISEEKINPGTKMNKVLRKARSLEVLAHQPDTTSTGALLPAPFPQHQKVREERWKRGSGRSRRAEGGDDAVVLRGGAPHRPHQLAGKHP
jgi:hypothetical protein